AGRRDPRVEFVPCARGRMTELDRVVAMEALDLGNLDVALVQPDEAGWDDARQAWNLAADQRPVAVAVPQTAADVAAVVRVARERGLRGPPQATGHRAGVLGSLERTILLKTSRMREARVDAGRQEARVEAGVQWADVVVPAAEHGLAALAGTSPGVGIVGYT